jgi:pimeloyl-ACP methyl ester carboxylesterase
LTSFAPSGKAQLAYDVEGEGPPVLLLHAGVTDGRSWRALVDRLAPGHQVIAFDRRGFGETTYEPEPHSVPDDAVAVLDHAGIDGPVAVVGSSMGGFASVDLTLDHPERVSRLVLVGAGVRGMPWPEEEAESSRELSHAIHAADEAGDLDTVNRLEAWFWLDGPTAREHRVEGPARDLFLEMNGRALAAEPAGEEVDRPSAWDRLGEISVPTLVLYGDLDEEDGRPINEAMAERIPDARFELLLETAHLPQLEAHPRFLDAVTDFLS